MKPCLLLLLALILATDATRCFAAKKDFKGLFGSYRREKFTENEANSTDFGIDLMISTLLPVTPVALSSEVSGTTGSPMQYATFFNGEVGAHISFNYNWLVFGNVGYFTYDTRKPNSSFQDNTLPLFHQFEMTAVPVIGGVKYRFSTEDFVPYVGLGVGYASVTRKGSFDYNSTLSNQQTLNAFVAQAILGMEFYISPRTGIRLETSAMYFQLPEKTFDAGNAAVFPILTYAANPVAVRYASGLFILF